VIQVQTGLRSPSYDWGTRKMDNNGRPNHIEDALTSLHFGSWFSWTDSKNKIYANLILTDKIWNTSYTGKIYEEGMIDNPYSKPTEQELTDKLAEIQATYDDKIVKHTSDKTNANSKLKALGLTDDEIKAIKGIE
jgi:hypothetical protein